MKRTNIVLLSVLAMVIGLSVSAHGALVDMHDGTIYDTDTQFSWLKDAGAGGIKSWDEAVAWAASLNVGGLTGWRLPNADPACGFNYNCRNSEMGHLYYVSLGNSAGRLTNSGPFTNLKLDLYWSGTVFAPEPLSAESAPEPPGAWLLNFFDGNQLGGGHGANYNAWAVRPGARLQSTPVPSSGTDGTMLNKATR